MLDRQFEPRQVEEQEEFETLYLARFKETGTIVWKEEPPQQVDLVGEVLVAGETDEAGQLLVREVRRVSLVSPPLDNLQGTASLAGPIGGAKFEVGVWGELPEFDMHLHYSLLGESECLDNDATFAQLEKLQGSFRWSPDEPDPSLGIPRMWVSIELDRLKVEYIGLIKAIKLEPVHLQLYPLTGYEVTRPKTNSLQPCTGSLPMGSDAKRSLAIRVVLLSQAWNAVTIEDTVKALIAGACEVWWQKDKVVGGGMQTFVSGIQIDPHPDIFVPASLPVNGYACVDNNNQPIFCVPTVGKESDLPNEIPGFAPSQNYVKVYLVDQLLESRGGGVAKRCTSPDAYVILEINHAIHNQYLLAHELGHVLSLRHPAGAEGSAGCEDSALPVGQPCSVMVPDRPNSNRITSADLGAIDSFNPPLGLAYQTIGQCARHSDLPQGFFHIVRDFPYDDGSEASSPKVPGVLHWTHSDVWNSPERPYEFDPDRFYASNDNVGNQGDSIYFPDYSPRHREPSYAGPNYMYVRVHTCQTLVHPVSAYLFLAVPGVTSEHLRGLEHNSVSVIPFDFAGQNLKPGAPKMMYKQWDVPPGYPSECCVFAVATSNNVATPPDLQDIIDHPNNFSFSDLFIRLGTDNDIAQRNLHIKNITSATTSSAMPLLPFENILEESAQASVEIDTSTAPTISSLTMTGSNGSLNTIPGGGAHLITLSDGVQPGESLSVQLGVELAQQHAIGSLLPITLRFLLNGQLVNGFQYVLRISTASEAAAQMLDLMYGVLRDVKVAWDLRPAHDLVPGVGGIARRMRETASGFATWQSEFIGLADRFEALTQGVGALHGDEPDREKVYQKLAELTGLLKSVNVGASPSFAEQVRELAYHMQMPIGRIVRGRQVP